MINGDGRGREPGGRMGYSFGLFYFVFINYLFDR